MDKNYNVDDILSEIKSRKSREKAGVSPEANAFPGEAAPPQQPPARTKFHFAETEPPAVPDSPEEPPAPRETEFHFDSGSEPDKRPPNPMDFTGHVRPITDKARMRPGILNQPGPGAGQPGVPQFEFQPPEEPLGAAQPGVQPDFGSFRAPETGQHTREHTRVLPTIPQDEPSFVRLSPSEGDAAFYEEEEYLQDSGSDHSAIDYSEYNSLADRRDVATDIARVKMWLFIRTAVTSLLTVLLFYLAFAGRYVMPLPGALEPVGETLRAYLIACAVLTALTALVNSATVGGGLISLFKLRAGSDTLVTLALLAAVGQGVAAVVKPESVDPMALSLYFPVAALAVLFNALGKMSMIHRIQQNFRIVATDKKKKALLRVEDDAFCHEFIPEATTRRPTIAYSVDADFFTDFLGLSYSDKYDVGINRVVAPVCLICAIIGGVVCYLLTESSLSAVSALTAVLCVCATLSTTFIENVPLSKLAGKLTPGGGMVSGNKAVEDFCDTAALILRENDLFPEGNVRLRGIKTFSQSRIDESILDAASVICSLNGALSPVFLQMIGGNRGLLKKVDNVVYENGMGVSAWVDSRRVLIGNRLLMQNHGVHLPPEAGVGQTKAPEDGDLLYLACSGEAAAQFAVSYHIDEDLAAELDQLAARDKLLIVYATDANITPHRVWELYGYPEELVRILPAERHAPYREMTAHRENAIAEIVYTGRAATMAGAITACINARGSILSATMIQLVQMVLGYGLTAFMAFMGAIGSLTVLQMLVYQAFWFAVIFIVQKTKQP